MHSTDYKAIPPCWLKLAGVRTFFTRMKVLLLVLLFPYEAAAGGSTSDARKEELRRGVRISSHLPSGAEEREKKRIFEQTLQYEDAAVIRALFSDWSRELDKCSSVRLLRMIPSAHAETTPFLIKKVQQAWNESVGDNTSFISEVLIYLMSADREQAMALALHVVKLGDEPGLSATGQWVIDQLRTQSPGLEERVKDELSRTNTLFLPRQYGTLFTPAVKWSLLALTLALVGGGAFLFRRRLKSRQAKERAAAA